MKIRSREELTSYAADGGKLKYLFFWGHRKPKLGVNQSCFSQWYEAGFSSEGNDFQTAEHFMMFKKALLFGDETVAAKVLMAKSPGEAKALGREVKGFDDDLWQQQRFEIVVEGNEAKFAAHPDLKDFLLKTGERVLVEASPVDRVWGIGLEKHDPRCEKPDQWQGLNLLGFALMEVRGRMLETMG